MLSPFAVVSVSPALLQCIHEDKHMCLHNPIVCLYALCLCALHGVYCNRQSSISCAVFSKAFHKRENYNEQLSPLLTRVEGIRQLIHLNVTFFQPNYYIYCKSTVYLAQNYRLKRMYSVVTQYCRHVYISAMKQLFCMW